MAWSYPNKTIELTVSQFQQWQTLLELRTGIDLSNHPSILAAGLKRSMQASGAENFDSYYQDVTQGPSASTNWLQLVDYLSITETSFFRQAEAMSLVRDHLLQELSAEKESVSSVDIWSAGCATGEEPFSLAMIANEVIHHLRAKAYLGVLATDINHNALAFAKKATYPVRRLERVPNVLRHKYFSAVDDAGKSKIINTITEKVCFVQSNLLEIERAPVMPMNIIFCQNLLVYFRRWRIHQLLNEMVMRLKPGGLLIVGPGEAAGWQNDAVNKVDKLGVQAFIRRDCKNI